MKKRKRKETDGEKEWSHESGNFPEFKEEDGEKSEWRITKAELFESTLRKKQNKSKSLT